MFVKVKVTAGSKKETFEQAKSDIFIVHVREKAQKNEANKRVCYLVAAHYGVPVSKVRIVNGHKQPSKMLSVDNDKED